MSSPCKIVVVIDAPGYGNEFAHHVAVKAFEDWKLKHPLDSPSNKSRYTHGDLTTAVFFESVISGKCHFWGAEGDTLAFVFDSNYGYLDVSRDADKNATGYRDNLLYVIGDLLRRRHEYQADSYGDSWSATVFCHGQSANALAWKIDANSKYEPRELGEMPFSFERGD